MAESLRETAFGLRHQADRLTNQHTRPQELLIGLAEVSVAVTRCCQLLEQDTTSGNARALRRMVQAAGLAEALSTRLTDALSALQTPFEIHQDTPTS